MKILHVLNSVLFSGAENVACQIIQHFNNNIDCQMAYCSPYSADVEKALQERGIKYYPVPSLSVRHLKGIVKRFKPDIIHSHDMKASFVSSFIKQNNRLIFHIHNNAFDSRRVSFKSIAFSFAAKKADHIFWVSKSSFEGFRFHERVKNKSEILYNIIDVESLYQRMHTDNASYDFDVIYAGRITYQKDPLRMINIFSKLVEKKGDLRIAVVGCGDMEDEARRMSSDLKLKSNVFFLGYMSNPLKIIHDSKILIMTSRWEGTPMVALESMALGTPIVTTPVDGLKDVIVNGDTGFMSDDDDELVGAIIRLLEDERLLKLMRAKCIDESKKRNDSSWFYESIYNSYLS